MEKSGREGTETREEVQSAGGTILSCIAAVWTGGMNESSLRRYSSKSNSRLTLAFLGEPTGWLGNCGHIIDICCCWSENTLHTETKLVKYPARHQNLRRRARFPTWN